MTSAWKKLVKLHLHLIQLLSIHSFIHGFPITILFSTESTNLAAVAMWQSQVVGCKNEWMNGLSEIGEVKMAKIIINALSNGCVRESEKRKSEKSEKLFPILIFGSSLVSMFPFADRSIKMGGKMFVWITHSLIHLLISFICSFVRLLDALWQHRNLHNVISYDIVFVCVCQELNYESILQNKSNLITFLEFLYTLHTHTYIIYILIHFVLLFCIHFTEADYTLDDSFWNDESPVGKYNTHSLPHLFTFSTLTILIKEFNSAVSTKCSVLTCVYVWIGWWVRKYAESCFLFNTLRFKTKWKWDCKHIAEMFAKTQCVFC